MPKIPPFSVNDYDKLILQKTTVYFISSSIANSYHVVFCSIRSTIKAYMTVPLMLFLLRVGCSRIQREIKMSFFNSTERQRAILYNYNK